MADIRLQMSDCRQPISNLKSEISNLKSILMNFLAHLYLADPTPHAWMGAVLPDLVRIRGAGGLHPAVYAAVIQHRRIDLFTDTHPLVARAKGRLFARHGRYSGILVDMFFDHFLACDWARYSPTPRPDFIAAVHRAFAAHRDLWPGPAGAIIDRLIAQDWLSSYATVAGMERALARMSHRFAERFDRAVDLTPAVEDLVQCRDGLAGDFHGFFPELIAAVGPGRLTPSPSPDEIGTSGRGLG
jgi:acyl carrier protein phosphodiesterase